MCNLRLAMFAAGLIGVLGQAPGGGGGANGTGNASVVVNVTVRGLSVGYGYGTPRGWGLNLIADANVVDVGVCPVGRYCPDGTLRPLTCASGTYSSMTGRWQPCSALCWENFYCV